MAQGNVKLDVFHETNITDGVYIQGLHGYSVVATDAPIRHWGGVAVFYRTLPWFMAEDKQKFGISIVSFHLP